MSGIFQIGEPSNLKATLFGTRMLTRSPSEARRTRGHVRTLRIIVGLFMLCEAVSSVNAKSIVIENYDSATDTCTYINRMTHEGKPVEILMTLPSGNPSGVYANECTVYKLKHGIPIILELEPMEPMERWMR